MTNAPRAPLPGRWFVISIFFLSSSINYLDRQSLATLAPLFRTEFHLTNADYGWIVATSPTVAALASRLTKYSTTTCRGCWAPQPSFCSPPP